MSSSRVVYVVGCAQQVHDFPPLVRQVERLKCFTFILMGKILI